MPDETSDKAAEVELAWRLYGGNGNYPRVHDGWLEILRVRHNNCCHYCGLDFNTAKPDVPWERATIDHYVPRAKGGVDTIDNCVLACELCNSAKADLLPEELAQLPSRRAGLLNARRS